MARCLATRQQSPLSLARPHNWAQLLAGFFLTRGTPGALSLFPKIQAAGASVHNERRPLQVSSLRCWEGYAGGILTVCHIGEEGR